MTFSVRAGSVKQEVAYLTWADLDLDTGIARVTPKAGWKPKNKMSREVMLPDWLIAALRKRRVARPNDVWVFPSATGMPACKSQLLYMLQAVAKRARVGGRVDLHKFRSTYASLLNKSGKVTVEEISGPPRARRHRHHALLPGAHEIRIRTGPSSRATMCSPIWRK